MNKSNPHLIHNWLVLIITLFFVGFVGYNLYLSSLKQPVDPKAQVQAFVIKHGETVDEIATQLEKAQIIRSAFVFKKQLKELKKDDQIQAGDYKLSGAMSLAEVVKTLFAGVSDKWVTLLEGWRVEEIAAKLEQALGIKAADFLAAAKAKEGFLFPDTYLFNKDATPDTIVAILTNTFDQRFNDDLKSQVKQKGLTAAQAVILASIVEREARSDTVRTKVAGILLKRLKIGMALNVDATVQYARDTQLIEQGNPPSKFWQPVTQADYKNIDSPYNTYLRPGLPPAPICNPSLSSLKAVAEADPSTPYLYYYHDSQGNSYYAATLEEHNTNVKNHP